MISKQIKLTILFVFGLTFSAQAQQTIPTTGGDASGSGGTISYTVGQIVYTTNSNANYSVTHGVQQVYEISTLGVDDFNEIKLEYLVYPNPTIDKLTLKVQNFNNEDLSYQIYDVNGREIKRNKIIDKSTTISMGYLPSAIYFLRVISGQQSLKIFKIIKN